MDSSASAEVGDQSKEVRKIHFAVPSSAPTQLDPRQVEMIRRRRPTPATLFRVADQGTPEDDQSTHQWVVGENGVLKPKRVNPNVYQPPSLKAVQKMAEAHMQNLGVYPPLEDPFEGEEYDDCPCYEERQERFPAKAAEPQGTGTIDQSEAPDEEDEDEELEEDIVEENTEEKTEEEEKMEEKTEVKVEETVEEKGKKVRKSVKF
ncbi:protein phosphatase 1 regulatory subunit 1B [Esox lucius]|uniref:Protein phosphatase 1 regulatory subunit 1B n=1 Tax=Esox lucius TaxID=8010 RepID=A0A3P9AAS3_ESOLU|nr:protein phosphatase 1 regulatory subunit 1B [Esox lucius]